MPIDVEELILESIKRRDEKVNIELAVLISTANDSKSVSKLFELLNNSKKEIQYDCIKTIYEIGARNPELISPHLNELLPYLKSKNNRLVWGAMTSISSVASMIPTKIFPVLPEIIDGSERGSVIAKDHAMKILRTLAEVKKYQNEIIPLMLEQLKLAPDNQFPSYALLISEVIDKLNSNHFVQIISVRIKTIETESKIKTLNKILKSLSNKGFIS